MGKIWVQTPSGRVIHLPIVEDDVNTADDPIVLPEMLSVNRCYYSNIQVVHPTLGTITFEFAPSGRMGSCNQCGVCCSHPVADCPHPEGDCGYLPHPDIDFHVCQYLVINKWRKWGDAANTECSLGTDIMNSSKGCTLFPTVPAEIKSHMTNCGYSF